MYHFGSLKIRKFERLTQKKAKQWGGLCSCEKAICRRCQRGVCERETRGTGTALLMLRDGRRETGLIDSNTCWQLARPGKGHVGWQDLPASGALRGSDGCLFPADKRIKASFS